MGRRRGGLPHKGHSIRGDEEVAVTKKITQAEYRSFQKAFDFSTRAQLERFAGACAVFFMTPPDREFSKFS